MKAMKNKFESINLVPTLDSMPGRGRPKGSKTKDIEHRRRLTIALAQSLVLGALPNEPVSRIEAALCGKMTPEEIDKFLGGGGGGKSLRRYLAGETALRWEGLKAITMAGRLAGYLPTDVRGFLDDLQKPEAFDEVRTARANVDRALEVMRQATFALAEAVKVASKLAVIDFSGLKAMVDVMDDHLNMGEEAVRRQKDFDLDILKFQLNHLFVSPHPDARRAPIPKSIQIENGWHSGLKHLGAMKNQWE
jgi:hypothetical protein